MKLLCVDDNATECKMIDLMLAAKGIDIAFARDGREAVEAFHSEEYDAILMDMAMSDMNGVQLTREIRQMEAGFHLGYTPILYFSDRLTDEQQESTQEAGGDGYLMTPFTSEALIQALDHVLTQASRAGLSGQMQAVR